MAFALLQFKKRDPSPREWGSQELAELYRVSDYLNRAGLPVETESGCSDEGDPWFVFVRQDSGDVIAHFARIDGLFVAVSTVTGTTYRGRTFRSVIDQVLHRHPMVLPRESPQGTRLLLHPSVVLTAFIAAAFLLATNEAQAAQTLRKILANARGEETNAEPGTRHRDAEGAAADGGDARSNTAPSLSSVLGSGPMGQHVATLAAIAGAVELAAADAGASEPLHLLSNQLAETTPAWGNDTLLLLNANTPVVPAPAATQPTPELWLALLNGETGPTANPTPAGSEDPNAPPANPLMGRLPVLLVESPRLVASATTPVLYPAAPPEHPSGTADPVVRAPQSPPAPPPAEEATAAPHPDTRGESLSSPTGEFSAPSHNSVLALPPPATDLGGTADSQSAQVFQPAPNLIPNPLLPGGTVIIGTGEATLHQVLATLQDHFLHQGNLTVDDTGHHPQSGPVTGPTHDLPHQGETTPPGTNPTGDNPPPAPSGEAIPPPAPVEDPREPAAPDPSIRTHSVQGGQGPTQLSLSNDAVDVILFEGGDLRVENFQVGVDILWVLRPTQQAVTHSYVDTLTGTLHLIMADGANVTLVGVANQEAAHLV